MENCCMFVSNLIKLFFMLAYLCDNFFLFIHYRCSFPQELPAGVQKDPEPPLQGVCACLHPSLRQCLQYGCRGPHQYLLQALLLLHLRVQPHWSLWTWAPGETLVWPQMCELEEREQWKKIRWMFCIEYWGLSVSRSELSSFSENISRPAMLCHMFAQVVSSLCQCVFPTSAQEKNNFLCLLKLHRLPDHSHCGQTTHEMCSP